MLSYLMRHPLHTKWWCTGRTCFAFYWMSSPLPAHHAQQNHCPLIPRVQWIYSHLSTCMVAVGFYALNCYYVSWFMEQCPRPTLRTWLSIYGADVLVYSGGYFMTLGPNLINATRVEAIESRKSGVTCYNRLLIMKVLPAPICRKRNKKHETDREHASLTCIRETTVLHWLSLPGL